MLWEMKFYRIDDLPPYVFATVDQLKRDLRREGHDVIDLGFGNPDIPSPGVAVAKLQEAAATPRAEACRTCAPPSPSTTRGASASRSTRRRRS